MLTDLTTIRTVTPHQVRSARRMIARPKPETSPAVYAACWNVLRLAQAARVVEPVPDTKAPTGDGAA